MKTTHGAATVTAVDFEQIPAIIKEPDFAVIGALRKRSVMNVYAKIAGRVTYLYFEEVLKGRRNKTLRGKTLYKVNMKLSFERFIKIVTMNNKTDITEAKKTAAGGHPGG